MCFGAGRARPERRASDHRQQQHIIRYHKRTVKGKARQAGKRRETKRRTDSERGRQSSYRATESGARERKGNGLHARSPPGAHDHIAEGPSSRSKPGGGHWPLAIGCGIAGSQNVAGRVLGPCWLAYAIQRITLCPRGSSGGASEAFREPATRAFCLTDDGDLT
jgi:hypothetical protein